MEGVVAEAEKPTAEQTEQQTIAGKHVYHANTQYNTLHPTVYLHHVHHARTRSQHV